MKCSKKLHNLVWMLFVYLSLSGLNHASASAEQFIWSIVCIAGILLFSNLPSLLNKDGKKSKLDRELEKELKKL